MAEEKKPNPLDQIKDLLNQLSQLGNVNVVGLDIGTSAIKVCELSGGKGKFKLLKFGMAKLNEGVIIEDQFEKPEEIINAIKQAFENAGIKNTNIAVGVYGPNTVCKRLQMPDGTPQEIEDQVMWESEQYIPFGADVSSIGHQILGDNEGGGKDVYMIAAREDLIEKFQTLLKDAGLKIKVVDLSMMALNNAFEHSIGDKLETYGTGTLILDLGAQTTKMLVYKNKAPIYTREIAFGGSLISEEIQRTMGVSFDEAEDLKINGDESGNLPEEIVQIINNILQQNLFSEIKKALNFFLSTSTEDKIEHCFLTGGSSLLPGLDQEIEKILEVKVELLNPVRRIEVDKKYSGKILDEIKAQGAISIALSMRR